MSDNSPPPDNSLAVEAMQENAAKQAKADADAKTASDAATLAQLRDSVRKGATSNVDQYFTSHGVDPTQYQTDIDSQLNNIANSIGTADPTPGAYYKTAGSDIFNDLTSAGQTRAGATLNQLFQPGYSADKLNLSMTDPIVNNLMTNQRTSADDVVKNMLKRGVLTQTGYNAAEGDLNKQASGVLGKLQGFAQDTVSGGQQSLDDIINAARKNAGNIQLGQSFDPTQTQNQVNDAFNRVVGNLGNSINAKVGDSNLFQTNGLAAIGGAAQGAGNTAYDPNAAAGIITDPNAPPKVKNPQDNENVF